MKSGAFPQAANEVAIDAATAEDKGYKIGDEVGVVAQGPLKKYKLTGIVSFGGVDSIGAASAAVFSLPGAQDLFDKRGQVDSILVKGDSGVPAADVRDSIQAVLPPTAAVQTAQEQDRFDLSGLDQFLEILRTALLVFGFISLFVGAFIIFNTLSITVAQRTSEFGLLRMIGASRRQVLRSVVLEAVVIGLLASIVGIVAGFGLSKGISALFESFGIDLPTAGTVFAARTVIVALLVGVIVTTLAGLAPALRATRIAPVAALREGSVDPRASAGRSPGPSRSSRSRSGPAWSPTACSPMASDAAEALTSMGVGSLLLFIGVALVAPQIARPMASVLGKVSAALGAGRPGGSRATTRCATRSAPPRRRRRS